MHERQARGDARVAQVREVARQLGRGEHPLVDDRAAGEARQRHLEAGLALDQAADHVQLALERRLVGHVLPGLDDQLADDRRRQPGDLTDEAVVDGDVAPPDGALALGGDRLLDQLLERGAPLGVARQVADADAVAAERRQLDARHRAAHERVGDLQQDARPVAGVGVGSLGAAVLHVCQRLERLVDDGVRALAPQLRDERDAAGVMLVAWVVEPGQTGSGDAGHECPRVAGRLRSGTAAQPTGC